MVTSVWLSESFQRFSHLKFWLLLTFILNHELKQRTETYRDYFQRDLEFCKDCFQYQHNSCQAFFNSIEFDTATNHWHDIIDLLPTNGKRATSFLKFKNNNSNNNTNNNKNNNNKNNDRVEEERMIAKYVRKENLDSLPSKTSLSRLKEEFLNADRLDGFQFCSTKNIERFIKYINENDENKNLLSIWLHLILNVEPLLMPLLGKLNFPVPWTYNVCGFTLYQAYTGKALIYYYNSKFELKLRIAKKILEAAIQFSEGFNGFRIYITDLSSDNIVFDDLTQRLYIVDLDTILIVDSEFKTTIHKHIYIDCDNCFAYSQQDICDYGQSDINLFSACQLLREDLKRQRNSGFLYPIPKDIIIKYPNFHRLLDNCVDCLDLDCSNRFAATLQLIQLIDVILKNFY